jgi:3-dehydroquinate dehydratase II
VNFDLLGQREPELYGTLSLSQLNAWIKKKALEYECLKNVDLNFFQSNSESCYLEKISNPWDGIILNPGAWTHTSLALADRLKGLELPFVEVHMTNLYARESIRQVSYCKPHALGVVQGFGKYSYVAALLSLVNCIQE